ncbi:MAG: glycoside hydrolase family 2 protein [Candidatus Sumerlaeota bacterium]|nr:glycoside hydrolase family 2 protein [Candidatus Sumerlaeota bacterium]
MRRNVQSLNTDWLYLAKDDPRAAKPNASENGFARVSVPHTNIELPYHGFSEQEHCFVSWYRRHFALPKAAARGRVFVDFDGAMIAATVFVNGRQAGPEHKGGYTPFSFDITPLARFGGEDNLLAARLDSSERKDIPPFGNVVDYLTFGGIYRDVRLRVVDPVHIKHIFARPGDVLAPRKRLDVSARVANTTSAMKTIQVSGELRDAKGKAWALEPVRVNVPAGAEMDADLSVAGLRGIQLWDLDNPQLYTVAVALDNGDAVETRIGFRAAEFRDDGAFYLNDKRIKLRGLNRHQTFPYVGQAAPARLQRRDAEILKTELACNIVRTSHYPQSPHFLDRCDELGLLVFEEIPGWQHIGDEAWQDLAARNVEAMIVRDRNHPSIVLWGVRINESKDNHDFYVRTNALAHRLDPTRQTGGVRCFFGSELLEDVYTNNDFQRDLREPCAPRYLNTEFCGHMFPTKTFDQEERVLAHALWHAHVQNTAGGIKTAGAIGWCAFDYNTHAQFGSGDRICYHGVMDMFRQPKIAAHFYASQEDPKKRIVLEPGNYWVHGDWSTGFRGPLTVFSNVDEIEVFVGEESRGRHKPQREAYPNLPHPPFVIKEVAGAWGGKFQPLRLVGCLKGRKVAERRMANDPLPARLEMKADDETLVADGADMTRISLRIVDECGNVCPFAMQPVQLAIEGPGVLVGDNPFPMPGGRGAVYVRTTRQTGTATITATTPRLAAEKVKIRVAK